ncbi:MAG: hypothetical protein HYY06_02200 [Deltaproteobacteria bacterium]|nr:hypothetical protein [Deltaproteobacteria bacterium]
MKSFFGIAVTSALFPLAVGCQSGPTDADYDDVAASVAALTANESGGDVGSMDDSIAAAQGETPEGLTASGSGSFQGDRLGLEYEYAVTCLDEAGQTMAICDSTTDSARLTVAWSGELTLPRYSASVSRTGDWTVTGLEDETAQFDGEGTFDLQSEFQALFTDETRTANFSWDAEYEAIRFRVADGMPISGEARFAVHLERTRERGGRSVDAEFDIDGVLTIDGNGGATLVLDGSRSYHVDLATGAVEQE